MFYNVIAGVTMVGGMLQEWVCPARAMDGSGGHRDSGHVQLDIQQHLLPRPLTCGESNMIALSNIPLLSHWIWWVNLRYLHTVLTTVWVLHIHDDLQELNTTFMY